ncbi:MAG: CheR family methyltransferase [Beijerinckiaceae bacterium]|nr:CheR family methyltransferase [Beijerinckiaceae bacterium]
MTGSRSLGTKTGGRGPGRKRGLMAANVPSSSASFPVIGIGASSGGLEACKNFLNAWPSGQGMALILVVHLDPAHESMMANLLASHTTMTVREAANGMEIEPEHLYVISPGTYLSVKNNKLCVSQPRERHGARMPIDFLLRSMAENYGPRAACVILSGAGGDGSLGLKAIKAAGGFVIAQDPSEAAFDPMPRNAILTGVVDAVLKTSAMHDALADHYSLGPNRPTHRQPGSPPQETSVLARIVELLRRKTAHDFTLYKPGTLQRRVHRRMAMLSIDSDDIATYFKILQENVDERDRLATDLLINVTSFFRDQPVFEYLANTTIPKLLRDHAPGQPLRIWVAGCSTGEETYSLVMLLLEEMSNTKSNVRLQIFASDADPEAVARAREGFYPYSISAEVSPARLERFFIKEQHGYRIRPELRASVVFTVHDLLADPPFARLDMISCRNLLIYFGLEAQKNVIALFHFALRDGGILLLGSAETTGAMDGKFEVVAKAERIYRSVGPVRSSGLPFSLSLIDTPRNLGRSEAKQSLPRQTVLADLCRRIVLDTYAPASILVNKAYECLYFLGPTDKYLKVAPGVPANDLFAMARDGVRTKLRAAIQDACRTNARTVVSGGRIIRDDGADLAFSICVQPVQNDGKELLLVCFTDEPLPEAKTEISFDQADAPRIIELERELDATRSELKSAIRDLEISSEDQKAINEEALSVNEEYQSANEELLTSKEELQSLNEELTALNSQLQETLERQRTTSNDLQNVLYSTDIATLFLDRNLNIRFFTPATKSLFNVIPSDVGRPLADLNSLSADEALKDDSTAVLESLKPIDREIETSSGVWFMRRVLPYRAHDGRVEGVVITYTDITERKKSSKALEAAKHEAELATIAKSRFLATASHDLRQPLQALALLQGLLLRNVEGQKAKDLVTRLDETLGAMTDMLNTLLDINQIEAGTIRANPIDFPIGPLLDRLKNEYNYFALAKKLSLHAVPCRASVNSDPALLEQMIRNLLSNALKYTKSGKVLLGCRRRGNILSIEVWDTGIGIPESEFKAIFQEYHQLDNPARERSHGLGLGLSIVQRLGTLLDHRVRVRSHAGKGSVFAVEVKLAPDDASTRERQQITLVEDHAPRHSGVILIVEDDPEISELLTLLLKEEGHHLISVPDGPAALDMIARDAIRPDLVLTDFNLPNGRNGLEVASDLRAKLHRDIPVIILTGDIGTNTLRAIAQENCIQLNKPIKLKELTDAIQHLLPSGRLPTEDGPARAIESSGSRDSPTIFIVDDDTYVRDGIRAVLEEDGRTVEDYADCESFFEAYSKWFSLGGEACLLLDATLPGMSGLELLGKLAESGQSLPTIMITGSCDVPMAVLAMKAGATDFIEKPAGRDDLLASVERALEQARDQSKLVAWRESAATQVASLTRREHEIMDMVLAGQPNKNIAADLGISQRTVENHRASIMKKTGSKSLPALVRLALVAASQGEGRGTDVALAPHAGARSASV